MNVLQLRDHNFSQACFEHLRVVMKKYPEQYRGLNNTDPAPDEFTYYLQTVGNALARLLTACEQLEHGVLFMSHYRTSPAMKKAGVNRATHLAYMVEGYIIRTQVVYDRAIRLVDRFFFLGNADGELRHTTIVNNVFVSDTEVPQALKRLRKHLAKFTDLRHDIIHRGSFNDDELTFLEMVALLKDSEGSEDERENYSEVLHERTQEFLRKRKRTYQRFNTRTFELVSALLDALELRRQVVEDRVSRASSGSS